MLQFCGIVANKTVEPQISGLNDLLLNIHSNYIPKKTVLWGENILHGWLMG